MAEKNFLEMQDGDVLNNSGDQSRPASQTDCSPKTIITEGVSTFVKWYKIYHSYR